MKRSVSLSERREAIVRQESAWQELRARVERFWESTPAVWVGGLMLLGAMFLVGAIETM